MPPYYRASPLHGGRVQGDLLKTRAKACTSEDLQLNAGGCLGRVLKHNVAVGDSSTAGANPPSPPLKAHLGRLTPRCREEAQSPSNGAALEPKWLSLSLSLSQRLRQSLSLAGESGESAKAPCSSRTFMQLIQPMRLTPTTPNTP